jgi:protein-S-isoprenylcysteine O-methyltransferase Ste14
MQTLELKIPPPLVGALVGVSMWVMATQTTVLPLPDTVRLTFAGGLALLGFGFDATGIVAFLRAKTTVNPMQPRKSAALVTTGVYRLTRNPMYMGMLCLLCAWGVFLSSAWAMLGPIAFVRYINRFQIAPEERMLAVLFGAAYADYTARVRRWL